MLALLATPLAQAAGRWLLPGLLIAILLAAGLWRASAYLERVEARGYDRATFEWTERVASLRLDHRRQLDDINSRTEAMRAELQRRANTLAAYAGRLAEEQEATEATNADLLEQIRSWARQDRAGGSDPRRCGFSAGWVRQIQRAGTPEAGRDPNHAR